ncbi:DUF6379 domain-containing protein [Phycicoccus sp. Soil803]|uniref:C-glycoside deglycosidase beta subunit domain-containing protein n=1 Tax=Phycicoccus sp. Soil803 TaxID=1736415 RepID=UPI003514AF53
MHDIGILAFVGRRMKASMALSQNGHLVRRVMIPDRILEEGTLKVDGQRASVEVRIPWYRALPASCIADVELRVDGQAAPKNSLVWTMNGRDFRLEELAETVDEWWFTTDSAVLSGDLAVEEGRTHDVEVDLHVYIPYIVTAHGVLLIEEHGRKAMEVAADV